MKSQFKKSISLICALILIVSVLSLSACGQGSNSIVGTWNGLFDIGTDAHSITFYKDGTFSLIYHRDQTISGTYTIVRDGTAVEIDPTGNWYSTMTMDYKLVSYNSLVLYINGSEYTLQREQ